MRRCARLVALFAGLIVTGFVVGFVVTGALILAGRI